jgi:hypothetical protein
MDHVPNTESSMQELLQPFSYLTICLTLASLPSLHFRTARFPFHITAPTPFFFLVGLVFELRALLLKNKHLII